MGILVDVLCCHWWVEHIGFDLTGENVLEMNKSISQ